MQRQLTGTTIRELRQRLGLRQAQLAERIGISASYFNQIEHNRRRIAGKLLSDIAEALGVDQALLAEGSDPKLTEVLRDAQISEPALTASYDTPEAFSGRFPAWARLLVARHRRVQKLEHLTESLTDRLAHDRRLADTLHELLSTVTAIRSSASILMDEPKLETVWRDRFQRNIIEDSARLSRGAQALVDYLNLSKQTTAGASSPREELEAFLDDRAHYLVEIEEGGLAAIPALLAASPLKSPQSRAMARAHMAGYAADAAALPLAALTLAVARHGLDPVALARDLVVDLPLLFRRLAAAPDSILPTPVGLLVCDASGSVLLKKLVEGFSLPRYSGACPLLPLFQSFSQPMRPIRRYVQQSGRENDTLLTYSIATPQGEIDIDQDLRLTAHMLIIPQLALKGNRPAEGAIARIGRTCSNCGVENCAARREPSIVDPGTA